MGKARGRQRQQNTTVLHITDSPNSQDTTVKGQAVASDPPVFGNTNTLLNSCQEQTGPGRVQALSREGQLWGYQFKCMGCALYLH